MVGLTRQINVSRPSDRLVSIIAIIATIANSATEQHHGCGCSQIIGSDLPPVLSIDRSSSDDPCTSTSSALRSSHDSRGAHDSLKPASKASVDQATTQQVRPHVPVDLSSVQASAPSRVAERQPVRPKHCTVPLRLFISIFHFKLKLWISTKQYGTKPIHTTLTLPANCPLSLISNHRSMPTLKKINIQFSFNFQLIYSNVL